MNAEHWRTELPADEREVIEAGIAASAPPGARQAVWSALAEKLPAVAAAGTAAAGRVTALSLLKPFAIGLGLGAVVVGGAVGYRSVTSTHPAQAPVALSAPPVQSNAPASGPVPAASAGPPAREPLAEVHAPARAPARSEELAVRIPERAVSPLRPTPSVASFPPAPAPAPAPAQENGIVVESRRVALARASLRAGDARGVLVELNALDVSFPRGQLLQEREGLRIEALLSLGETTRARELARRFLARYPMSPHAPAVERALR